MAPCNLRGKRSHAAQGSAVETEAAWFTLALEETLGLLGITRALGITRELPVIYNN